MANYTTYDRRLRRLLIRNQIFPNISELDKFEEKVKEKKSSLATMLISNNIIADEDLLALIAIEADTSPVSLSKIEPDPDILIKVDKEFADKNYVFPLFSNGEILTVAMADPFDQGKIESLEIMTKCKVRAVVSTETAIKEAIKQYYVKLDPKRAEMEQKVQEVAQADIQEIIDDSTLGVTTTEDEYVTDEVDKGIIKLVNKVIIDAYKKNVSDIHVEPYHGKDETMIRFRIDGECMEYQRIPNSIKRAFVTRIKIMSNLDIAERRLPQDGKIQFKKYGKLDIELRVAIIPTVGGNEDAVLRILAASKPMPLDQMGFLPRNLSEFKKLVAYPYGLVLVVGPTGSGKTTTLHSAMGYINTPKRKIWTAEDPVEITQRGLRQVQVQAKIGFTFAAAMRSFLRANPDVIMVGEMRDHETAAIGIEASLTGHLVLSTLHTNSAPETIVRLIDMGLDPFNFADSLLGVVAQRLTRRLCSCKQPHILTKEEHAEYMEEYGVEEFLMSAGDYIWKEGGITVFKAVGCEKCNKSGCKGRMGIHELLVANDEIKAIIQRKGRVEEIRQAAIRGGMTTLKQDGIIKVFQGFTGLHQVRAVCIK